MTVFWPVCRQISVIWIAQFKWWCGGILQRRISQIAQQNCHMNAVFSLSGILNHKLGKVVSLMCRPTLGNIAITIRHCNFESALVWKHSTGPFIFVLGTQPRQNVLGTCSRYTSVHITSTVKCSRYPFVQVENGTHLGLRSMTYCVYTAQRVRSFWCALSVLIAICMLSPAHLEHCSRYTSVHTCFGCVLRGTVLAGTILFRTHSDYKKWCVPRTCSENMFPLELYREQVWTPS